MPVTSVIAENQIPFAQASSQCHTRKFLADASMDRAKKFSLGEKLEQPSFHSPDGQRLRVKGTQLGQVTHLANSQKA
jgi:hypothetical protein